MRNVLRSVAVAFAVTASACARAPQSRVTAPPACADTGRTARGIYYECVGTGQDVVVLIHGFSVDRRMWDGQVAALRDRYRVVTYDLRAHGRTPAATAPFMATDDLLGLLDERHIARVTLVGLSNGARIALDFALLFPARVRGMVLAAPGASGYQSKDPMTWMSPVIAAARAGDLERAAALWAATPLMHIPSDTSASNRVRALTRDNRSLWSIRTNPERMLDPPAMPRLHEVRVPTLLISGDADLPDLRRQADTLARAIPGAKIHVVRGAGHMVNLAAPEEFNRVMLQFLRTGLRAEPAPQ